MMTLNFRLRPTLCSLTTLVGLLLVPYIRAAGVTPLDYWTWLNPQGIGGNLYSLAQGNGTYLVTGGLGGALTSIDGAHWQNKSLPISYSLGCVAIGKGVFVGYIGEPSDVGIGVSTSIFLASTDAENWVVTYTQTNYSIYDRTAYIYRIFYANGQFVAVGGNDSWVNSEKAGWVMTSPDGTNWTTRIFGPGFAMYDVIYAQDRYAAVGDAGGSMTSTDGWSWQIHTNQDPNLSWELAHVIYFGGHFLALANTGYRHAPSALFSSTNGLDWEIQSRITEYAGMRTITVSAGKLLTSGESGQSFESVDGTNWSAVQLPVTNEIYRAENMTGTNFLLGADGTILTRTNNEAWKISPPRMDIFLPHGAAFGANTFVVCGDPATATSRDGQTWTLATNAANAALWAVTYAQDKFIAVGINDTIMISSNAQDWLTVYTNYSQPGARALQGVAWNGNLFLAVGWQGAVVSSTNGIDWENHQYSGLPGSSFFYGLAAGNGLFVSSMMSSIATTTDGISWTVRTNTTYEGILDGVYGKGKFVLAGAAGRVWVSDTGVDWQPVMLSDGLRLARIIMAGDYFVVGGEAGLIFTSKDALNWETHFLPTPNGIQALAFGYDRIIAGATDGQILQSDPVSGPLTTIRSIVPIGNNRIRLSLLALPGSTFEIQGADSHFHWSSLGLRSAPLGRSTFERDIQRPMEIFRAPTQ